MLSDFEGALMAQGDDTHRLPVKAASVRLC
jgi:hypothetical protein